VNPNSDVTILGSTGMLGSACVKEFPNAKTPTRLEIDAETDKPIISGWIINCIGAIPQKEISSSLMWKINNDFPRNINGGKVIQIATDCVFRGDNGPYSEDSIKDALDDYGKSKIAGEVASSLKIRCSIVGPDKTDASLFEWVRQQPLGAKVDGFVDHIWNGITTQVFAKLCSGLIQENVFVNETFHFVPADKVSKFELVKMIAEKTGRTDLTINPVETSNPVDRTLITNNPEMNLRLWSLAGYSQPPSIQEMINALDLQ
jgi:dTDP-4-dehydrorhamnose reductase